MESSAQNDTEGGSDDKDVRQIIDQLKSQGLFDQFRKDFLADVDTKPAYQNLTQRVEGYVNRFLSRQVWTPRLNKNQLRDNLRRQINQSGMLINGVERVINQVVDPKILQVIKPKIDEVVCAHFGIDLKERQRRQEDIKQQQKQKLQNLMSLNVTPPDNDRSDQQPDQGVPKAGMSFPPGFTPDMWQQHMQHQSMMGSFGSGTGMMNFPMATPFPQQLPFGMAPQMFPYMQNSWNNFMIPPMSGQVTSAAPGTTTTETTVTTGTTTISGSLSPKPSTSAAGLSPIKPDLPPLPPTPPPPGTEDEEVVEDPGKPKVLDDIPLPPPTPKKVGQDVDGEEEVPSLDEIPLPPPSEQAEGDDAASKRPYKFAWEDDDLEINSDVTVSSVHTSDLSEYEDDQTTESELEYSDLTDHGNDDEEEDDDEKDELEKSHPETYGMQEKITTERAAELEVSEKKTAADDDKPPVLEAVLETVPPVLEPEPSVSMVTKETTIDQESETVPSEITTDTETFTVEAEVTTLASEGDNPADKEIAAVPPVLKSIDEIRSEEDREEAPTLESVTVEGEVSDVMNSSQSSMEEEQFTFEAVVQNILPEQDVPAPTTTEGNMSQSAISARMAELEASLQGVADVSPPKKKLISLQYNYSDSEDEETREERRARIAKEKEERYLKRQQRRAELEAKRKERDQERIRLREERKKAKEKMTQENKDKNESVDQRDDTESCQDNVPTLDNTDSLSSPTKSAPESPDKRPKQSRSPEKRNKKSKAELKEELVKQKLMEKKAALRRQRTRNRRYTSEEFTSIFTEKQQPYTSRSYSEVVLEEQVVEETVSTMEGDLHMGVTVDCQTVDVTEEQTVEEVYSQMPGTPTQDETPEPQKVQGHDGVGRQTRSRKHGDRHGQGERTNDDGMESSDVIVEEAKRGNKRKRAESDRSEEEPRAVESDTKSKQAKMEDEKLQGSSTKRYDQSDLYKPRPSITRGSRRRGSSPTATPSDNSTVTEGKGKDRLKPERVRLKRAKPKLQLPPEDEIIEITSRSPTPQPPKSRSHSRSSSSRSRSYSRSRSRSRSHSHSKSHRRKKKRKKKVKKRSRSHSGSEVRPTQHTRDGASPISSSSLSISESSRSRHSSASSSSGSKSSRSKSRSRSRSSESSVDEFGRRKRKAGSIPLDYVDFGEAAKMARRSLVGVDFGEAERRSKQERGMPVTTPPVGGAEKIPLHKGVPPMMYGPPPVPGPAEVNPYNMNVRRPFRKRGGFQQQQRGGSRGVPRTNALRKNWFHGSWQYQDGSSTGQTSGSDVGMRGSPPMSPRRYYDSDIPRITDDLESLSPESDEDLPPHEQQRRYRTTSRSSPPYVPRGRLSPVSMYPYDDPDMSPTRGHRGQSPVYMRERSPSLSPPHMPGRRTMSPSPPLMRRRSRSISPPPPHVRMHRSDSSQSPPPYVRGRRSPSPISPSHIRGRRSYTHSPPPRSQSPFSHLRGHRSPSPMSGGHGMLPTSPGPYDIGRRRGLSPPSVMRGQRSPTPEEYPMYRSPSPVPRPVTRGYHSPSRSPTPHHMSKSPSPPHRPVTRGYHSPSRSPSPPSRPMTRATQAVSPPTKGVKKGSKVPLSPTTVGMSSRLRARHTAPQRYSPPLPGRQRPPSPGSQPRGDKKKR